MIKILSISAVAVVLLVAVVVGLGSGVDLTDEPEGPENPTTPTDPIIQFTLTYDSNSEWDDLTPPSPIKSNEGTNIIVADEMIRITYAFVEWNTNVDGTGTSYDAGTPITMNADITLYAQWEYA